MKPIPVAGFDLWDRLARDSTRVIQALSSNTVLMEPGNEHWHGVDPTNAMAQIALCVRNENEIDADLIRPVTDEE